MKQEFVIHNGSSSLALVFTGWGTDAQLFADCHASCDLMVASDYRDFSFDITDILTYNNIYVFGWSFGVFAASKVMEEYANVLPICRKVAINGTMTPIDDHTGIPHAIAIGTCANLNERNLQKFNIRMCGGRTLAEQFTQKANQRDIDALREELQSVIDASSNYTSSIQWDKAIICANDYIFVPNNQLNAWQDSCNHIVTLNDAHLPQNLAGLICENIINKSLLQHRFSRIFDKYNDAAVSQKHISQRLFELWQKSGINGNGSIMELGCGTGFLTRLYIDLFSKDRILLNDLCADADVKRFVSQSAECRFEAGDAESMTFLNDDEQFDCIVSASVVQWFENLPKFFAHATKHLNQNGLIAISTFGLQNMREIELTTGQSLRYYSSAQLHEMLEPYFTDIQIIEEFEQLEFEHPIDVLRHIKATGVNSIANAQRWTPTDLERFNQNYPRENGCCMLTYNPIYVVAKKK